MDGALAVVESTDSAKRLVRDAGGLVAQTGGELVLLATMNEDEYEHTLETMSKARRTLRRTSRKADGSSLGISPRPN